MITDSLPITAKLFLSYPNAERSLTEVKEFLRTGKVALDKTQKVEIREGSFWHEPASRAQGRSAHSWFFARPWYAAAAIIDEKSRTALLEFLGEAHQIWSETPDSSESMQYHDETTAQRAMTFVSLLHAYSKHLPPGLRESLTNTLNHDLSLLYSDNFYAGLNNHGMFQDLALLVAADHGLVGGNAEDYENKAFQRLHQYFETTFTADGIHTENNPTYHVMVSRYLAQVVSYAGNHGHGEQFSDLQAIMKNADKYAAFAVTPFKDFVPISDTNLLRLTTATAKATFGEGHLLGSLTDGTSGTLPSEKVFVAEKSGYGIARTGWTSTQDSYIFFSSAYNANYHKHSDELSLYYASQGLEILTEAGPNGYEYTDPFTKYGFSSFAHNSMTVDGVGLPRTDNKAHLTVLKDNDSSPTLLDVSGTTERYTGVKWSRRVVVDTASMEKQGFTIQDSVRSDETHTYRFLWHIGRDITPFVRGSFIEFFHTESQTKVAEMQWQGSNAATVRVFNGLKHPRVQGWQFPQMGEPTPSNSVEIEFSGTNIDVEWTMRTQDFVLLDRGITPFAAEWNTFQGEKTVHYLLDLPESEADVSELLIVLSAINPVGDFTYNYRASLANFQGAVLYVLDDFGDQGSYYLSSGRNLAEFRSVQGLLKTIISDLNIPLDAVTALGSSKGGASALMHGVTLGVGNVYSGAPQYHIGDFLKVPHPNVLAYMSGGTTEGDIYWANNIALDVLSSGNRSTEINVIVGLGDSHYRRHAIPLVDDARSLGYEVAFLTIPGAPHSTFGGSFRHFLRTLVSSKSPAEDFTLPHLIGSDADQKTFGVSIALPPGYSALGQLYRNQKKVGSLQTITKNSLIWNLAEPGRYRARIYVSVPGERERRAFGTQAINVQF